MSTEEKFLVVFACRFVPGPDGPAGALPRWNGSGVKFVRLACGAAVHPGLILGALEEGAEGVLVLTCGEESCHFQRGAGLAAGAVGKAAKLLELIGWPPDRVRHVAGVEGVSAARLVEETAAGLGIGGRGSPERIESPGRGVAGGMGR